MRIPLALFLLLCALLVHSDAQQSTVDVQSTAHQPYDNVVGCIHEIGFTSESDFEWPGGYLYGNLFAAKSGKRLDGATWTNPSQSQGIALRVALLEYADSEEVKSIMTTFQSREDYFKHYAFIWPFDERHLIVLMGGCNLDKAQWRALLNELDAFTKGSIDHRFTCECGGVCRTY